MVKENFIAESPATGSSGIYRIYRVFTKLGLGETADLSTTLTFCPLNHRHGG